MSGVHLPHLYSIIAGHDMVRIPIALDWTDCKSSLLIFGAGDRRRGAYIRLGRHIAHMYIDATEREIASLTILYSQAKTPIINAASLSPHHR